MKRIRSNELYDNLGTFLKGKGIEFKDGSYSQRIRQACGLLTEVINVSQKGLDQAREKVDRSVESMRQIIHEKTAPKGPPPPPTPAPKARRAAPAKKARAARRSR